MTSEDGANISSAREELMDALPVISIVAAVPSRVM
jgi:hypothetical protein